MPRSTFKWHNPQKWAMGFRREMQTAIGRQLRVECELPQELVPTGRVAAPSCSLSIRAEDRYLGICSALGRGASRLS
jgi:hypothetical protein